MKKAVIVFSGGVDSVCAVSYLKSKYDLYGITFSYGQKANSEIAAAKSFAKKLGLKQHKIIDIGFMKDLYGNSNVLTSSKRKIPSEFEYSIVVPIRNAVFLSIASAWAFTLNATLVAYGAHTGDKNYPDCRPIFAKKLESAFNQGEIDGIKSKLRKNIEIWSPYRVGLSKSDLLKSGMSILGDSIFKTWSCYSNKRYHCGVCESCNNRKTAFAKAGIIDKTKYLK
ncbi:MAG: 7-cyano-7-deazaguanine synthase [Nitrosopumilus sp.]|nr:7-cyano-7-deazaguanine synthase [Nitrosopumilus sp.]MDF2423300.1 7-cyano-7-deazaguanine synthase [Nitrosopumilus sp.]MDF2424509.1 7-cyano-7-deazaguanine synthase [Nitrosopumilus sp.]MDF2425212.1 7-cyano-7-deazaguanine synthase [Nitrosopumilus sp.]MDF2426889.1 7-cyano-7-deazaguanine synthase [Nitrosopumilus sp.]